MGVYIKGMEMPKEGFVEILIRDDGTVQQTGQSYRIEGTDYYTPYVGEMPVMYEAISIPPHGRLIDADALIEHLEFTMKHCTIEGHTAQRYREMIVELSIAPTIMLAEEG